MSKLDPRTPPGVTAPIYRHSGSFTPTPTGVSDGNAGGQVSPSAYPKPHISDRSSEVK
jgi:hypothetical protein